MKPEREREGGRTDLSATMQKVTSGMAGQPGGGIAMMGGIISSLCLDVLSYLLSISPLIYSNLDLCADFTDRNIGG